VVVIPVGKGYVIEGGICDAVDIYMSKALGFDCLSMAIISGVNFSRMNRNSMIIVVTAKGDFLPISVLVDLSLRNVPTVSKPRFTSIYSITSTLPALKYTTFANNSRCWFH
jgi:hypothetical protein